MKLICSHKVTCRNACNIYHFLHCTAELENDWHYYSNDHSCYNLTILRPRKLLLIDYSVKLCTDCEQTIALDVFESTLSRLPSQLIVLAIEFVFLFQMYYYTTESVLLKVQGWAVKGYWRWIVDLKHYSAQAYIIQLYFSKDLLQYLCSPLQSGMKVQHLME